MVFKAPLELGNKFDAQPLADAGDAEPEKARGKADVIKIEALMELDRIARDGRELGLKPFLDLGMRLGEGSGCPIAFRVVEAACAVMDTMATFPEAAIDDTYLTEIRAKDSFTV